MPDAVKFILGADSAPFAREMRQMETLAQSSGRNIGMRMAEAAHLGYSGILREGITIPREIIEGRGIGRIIGSSSILLGYLAQLAGKSKEVGSESQALAETWDKMAWSAARQAKETRLAAIALQETAMASGVITEADNAATVAAFENAAAQEAGAIAYKRKAVAAAEAAEAEVIEAEIAGTNKVGFLARIGGLLTMPISAMVAGVGILVGLLAGLWYGWHRTTEEAKRYEEEMKKLFGDESIARHLRGLNQVADAWERIGESARRVTYDYNAAVSAAERLAAADHASDEHEQRMDELHHRYNMANARTHAARDAERQRYNEQQTATAWRHFAFDEVRMRNEVNSERTEATNLRGQATAMRTPGGQHILEEDRAKQLLQMAEEKAERGRKFLEEHPDNGAPAGYGQGFWSRRQGISAMEEYRQYELDTMLRGRARSDIDALPQAQAYERDQAAGRRSRDPLIHEATRASERVASLTADWENRRERARLEIDRATEERNMQAALEGVEERRGRAIPRGEVNAAQRIGFSYLEGAPAEDSGLAVARRSEAHLASIDRRLSQISHHTAPEHLRPVTVGRGQR